MECPKCGTKLDEDNYCDFCCEFISSDDDLIDFDEPDYESMINNGEEICLNCTYWSVSPYGSAYGMVCRKGYITEKPDDSCMEFVPESHFANYGDSGQFQFDETDRSISNKLYYWKNSR